MYSLSQILEGVRHPSKAARELRRTVLLGGYLKTAGSLRQRRAIDVMDADWDNLLILDACRYDLFEQAHTLPGTLRKVVSKGTGTDEFLEENVDGRAFPGTVYLTANPHLHFVDAEFHDIQRLWETDWDEDLDTVPPDAVAERTVEADEAFPHKRLVAHFVQPHYPFIGPAGRELADREIEIRGFLEKTPSVFHHLSRGVVDRQTVWNAYRENLEVALPHVERLIEELPGKTVVTSDHGNAFGEWGIYGHGGPKIPALVDVPWLENTTGDRKDITESETTVSSLDLSVDGDNVVEERLADLGYV